MEEHAQTPMFKTGKKRKLLHARARTHDQVDQTDEQTLLTPQASQSDTTQATLSFSKRPRKHGITFSDAKISAVPEETALVVASAPAAVEPRDERFVKSTGRAVVTEDKHMSAFIDARLAALKTVPAPPSADIANSAYDSDESSEQEVQAEAKDNTKLKIQAIPLKRSSRRRPRRVPPPPTEADLERNSAVDRLMQEGAAPMYDQSTALKASDGNSDNDAAAAAAFKAEFLESLQDKRHSRKTAASTTSGPKLGGGRMVQRMKAAEEQNKQKE